MANVRLVATPNSINATLSHTFISRESRESHMLCIDKDMNKSFGFHLFFQVTMWQTLILH